MRAEDITDQTSEISSSQDESIKNIIGANLFQIQPSQFQEHKDILQPEIDHQNYPPVASPVVAQNIKQSPDHAAAIAPDADSMSWIERQLSNYGKEMLVKGEASKSAMKEIDNGWMEKEANYISQRVKNKLGPEQDLSNLNWKKLTDPNFSTSDQMDLTALRISSKDNFGAPNYGVTGPLETLPADAIAAGIDMGAVIPRNAKLISEITGLMAVRSGVGSGLIGGLAGGPAGAFAGVVRGTVMGARTGFGIGYQAAALWDGYKSAAGATYQNLEEAKGPDGKPLMIDEANKKALSHGVGLVSGIIQLAATRYLIGNVPEIQQLVQPQAVGALAGKVENEGLKQALISIGRSMSALGGASAAQEAVNIVGEEIGKTYKDGKVSFTNGLMNAAQKIETYKKTIRAAAVGGLTAAGIHVASSAIGATVRGVQNLDNVPGGEPGQVHETPSERDVTPVEQLKLNPGSPTVDAEGKVNFPPDDQGPTHPGEQTPAPPPEELANPRVKELSDKATALLKILNGHEEKLNEFNKSGNEDARTRRELEHNVRSTERELWDTQDALNNHSLLPELGDTGPNSTGEKIVDSLNFQNLFESITKVKQVTSLYKKNPALAADLVQQMLEEHGISKVWLDPEEIKKFSSDEERAKYVRNMIGMSDDNPNAPIEITSAQAFEMHDKYPSASEYFKQSADHPSPSGAQKMVEQIKAAAAARTIIQNRYMESTRSPEQRAYELDIKPSADDETITQSLGSKEVAEAYLGRLDVNESAVKDTHPEVESIPAKKQQEKIDSIKQKMELLKSDENFRDEFAKDTWSYQGDLDQARLDLKKPEFRFKKKQLEDEIAALEKRRDEKWAPQAFNKLSESLTLEEMKLRFMKADAQSPDRRQKLNDIQRMRQRVSEIAKTLPSDQNHRDLIANALERPQPLNDIHSEQDYLREHAKTLQVLKDIIPPKELEKFSKLSLEARENAIGRIKDSTRSERESVADIYEEIAKSAEHQNILNKINHDPNIAVVEHFLNGRTAVESKDPRFAKDVNLRDTHHKEGNLFYAIDPRTLSESQTSAYLKHPRLKKLKVFAKGGQSPEDIAKLVGVNTGENLLKILSTTPTRQEAIDAHHDLTAEQIRKEAFQAAGNHDHAIEASYNNQAEMKLQEMQYMVDKSWAVVKKGISRVLIKVPKLADLKSDAAKAIGETKVGDLNVKQFEVGELKSRRMSAEKWLAGDFLGGAVNKKYEVQNIELQIATKKAIVKTNKEIKFLGKLNDPKIQQILRDAGPQFVKAMDELGSVYKFKKVPRDKVNRGAFQKWVAEQVHAGLGNFEISPSIADPRISIYEMTVDEVSRISEVARAILHSAEINKKMLLYREGLEFEEVVEQVHDKLINHRDRDLRKTSRKQREELTTRESFVIGFGEFGDFINNIEHKILQVDEDQVAGSLHSQVIAQLKGIGKYSNVGMAKRGELTLSDATAVKQIVESFNKEVKSTRFESLKKGGISAFSNLRMAMETIPEWKDNKGLKYGNLAHSELFVMLLNMGNPENAIKLAEGYDTDIETIQKVLNRTFEFAHIKMAQRFGDLLATKKPLVRQLELDTKNVEPKWVEVKPYVHQDGVVPGWYWPMMADAEMNVEKLAAYNKEALDIIAGKKEAHLHDTFRASDMTAHNHTKRRTSVVYPLTLSFNSISKVFDSVNHDLAFRLPLRDTMKLLTEKTIAEDITAAIGLSSYKMIMGQIVNLANHGRGKKMDPYDTSFYLRAAMGVVQGGQAAAYLVGNVGSMAIQLTAFAAATNRMGASGVPHVLKIMKIIAENPLLIPDLYKAAGEIHPTIKEHGAGLEEGGKSGLHKWMPDKYTKKLQFATAPLDNIRLLVNHLGFKILGEIDTFLKVIVANSSYSQFMSGDAHGFPLEKLKGMSDKEIDHQAKVYASSVVRLTLTSTDEIDKAPIQQHEMLGKFVPYWNDARNLIQNILRVKRNTVWAVKDRDVPKAAREITAGMIMIMMIRTAQDTRMHFPNPLTRTIYEANENGTVKSSYELVQYDSTEDAIQAWADYAAWAPLDLLAGETPFAREVVYAAQSMTDYNRKFKVAVPAIVRPLTDAAQTVKLIEDLIYGNDVSPKIHDQGVKSALMMTSYLTGGWPVNTDWKLGEMASDMDIPDAASHLSEVAENIFTKPLHDDLGSRIKAFVNADEKLPKNEQLPKEVIEELQKVKEQLDRAAKGASNDNLQHSLDAIKEIESKGKWNARNPKSSAFGIYQFTDSTWKDIMSRAPQLGLTEAGRLAKNPEQQEKAMKWMTDRNIKTLKKNGIEPSTENIYAAHFLGIDKAVEVLNSPSVTKLKSLVSKKVLEDNGFSGQTKVKDFRQWLTKKINSVSTQIASLDKSDSERKD